MDSEMTAMIEVHQGFPQTYIGIPDATSRSGDRTLTCA